MVTRVELYALCYQNSCAAEANSTTPGTLPHTPFSSARISSARQTTVLTILSVLHCAHFPHCLLHKIHSPHPSPPNSCLSAVLRPQFSIRQFPNSHRITAHLSFCDFTGVFARVFAHYTNWNKKSTGRSSQTRLQFSDSWCAYLVHLTQWHIWLK